MDYIWTMDYICLKHEGKYMHRQACHVKLKSLEKNRNCKFLALCAVSHGIYAFHCKKNTLHISLHDPYNFYGSQC